VILPGLGFPVASPPVGIPDPNRQRPVHGKLHHLRKSGHARRRGTKSQRESVIERGVLLLDYRRAKETERSPCIPLPKTEDVVLLPVPAEFHAVASCAPVNVIRELVGSLDAMLLNVRGDPDSHAEPGDRGPAQVETVLRIVAGLVPVTQKMLVQVAVGVSKVVHQVRCQDAVETNSRLVPQVVDRGPVRLYRRSLNAVVIVLA